MTKKEIDHATWAALTALWVLACGVVTVPCALLAGLIGLACVADAQGMWQRGSGADAVVALCLLPTAVWAAGSYAAAVGAGLKGRRVAACGLAAAAAFIGFAAFFAVAWLARSV